MEKDNGKLTKKNVFENYQQSSETWNITTAKAISGFKVSRKNQVFQ